MSSGSRDGSGAEAGTIAAELLDVLDKEFEALKRRDLGYFERLQPSKNACLERLGSLLVADPARSSQAKANHADVGAALLACRDAHRRNETLLKRQLEAVRGALQAISAGSPLQSVEVYDRLGKLRARGGGRGVAEA